MCAFISSKKKAEGYFSENSVFETKLKPRVAGIIGSDYKFEDGKEHLESQPVGIQCTLPIVDNLKLSAWSYDFARILVKNS